MRIFILPAILLVVAGIAITQSTPVALSGTFEGSPSVELSNGKLTLTLLTKGATIAGLQMADDPSKLNPLWNPVRMARELGNTAQPTSTAGSFVCVDGFGQPSAEERTAGLPMHGEAHLIDFAVKSGKQGNTSEVTFTGLLPIVQESFTRTVRMVDGENVVYVESELANLLGFDRPVVWAEHATVGSPFLESGVTVFDLSGVQSQTRTFQPQAPNANPNANQRRIAPGKDFSWPIAPGLDGNPVDMRLTPMNPHYIDHVTTMMDPSRDLAWTTALNPKLRMVIGWVFKREEYPWIQTWGNSPATQKLAHGMEFGTQPYDVPRRPPQSGVDHTYFAAVTSKDFIVVRTAKDSSEFSFGTIGIVSVLSLALLASIAYRAFRKS